MLTDGHAVVRVFAVELCPNLGLAWGIGGVYTRPDERGKGRATKLLRHAQELYSPLVLHTTIDGFYERLGFVRRGSVMVWPAPEFSMDCTTIPEHF